MTSACLDDRKGYVSQFIIHKLKSARLNDFVSDDIDRDFEFPPFLLIELTETFAQVMKWRWGHKALIHTKVIMIPIPQRVQQA